MPQIHPFRAVQYAAAAAGGGADVSSLLAPPYDVLDSRGKEALLRRDPRNMVAADLPHLPAKELGPDAAYQAAAGLLRSWLADGTLVRRQHPAIFAYRQRFVSSGRTVERSGVICSVDLRPFGPASDGSGGILPHEETFSGPKEDRLALMRATGMQLSPIFGLHTDASAAAAKLIAGFCAARGPDLVAKTDDGTRHEVWAIEDADAIASYQRALRGEDIFIADGHHRYTTALNYLKELEAAGPVTADHPARQCMFVLISMADPGLVIWPTHRILGGMAGYSIGEFLKHAGSHLRLEPISGGLEQTATAMDSLARMGDRRFGLFDVGTGRGFVAVPAHDDPLAQRFGAKPKAWRDLTVAFAQYLLVEEVCQAKLNNGQKVQWAFPHTVAEVAEICRGGQTGAGGGKGFVPQLVVLVRPTPLEAVRQVSRAGELMPQKSTFFYPKLATGLALREVHHSMA